MIASTTRERRWQGTAALLREGRHAELAHEGGPALGANARERALVALGRAEAHLAVGRPRAALDVTAGAERRVADPDLVARLALQRAHATWLLGEPRAARAAVEAVLRRRCAPLTRARAEELLAFFDLRAHALDAAEVHLAAARASSEGAGVVARARLLGLEAALCRASVRLAEAERLHDARLALLREGGRPDAVALALSDRGDLLAFVGRWAEARRDLEAAARIFHGLSDPREVTLAGVRLAAVDLFTGAFSTAQAALGEAREVLEREASDPRTLAEVHLLLSDLALATCAAERALSSARTAVALFKRVAEGEGESRARVRLALALAQAGEVGHGLLQAGRALRAVPPARHDLVALAEISRGRLLLRGRPAEAEGAFVHALQLVSPRTGLAFTAEVGRLLARREEGSEERLAGALRALEEWGDRRLLYLCEDDVQGARGALPVRPSVRPLELPAAEDAGLATLADVALAVPEGADEKQAWVAAMRALRTRVPWVRAAWIDGVGWELRDDAVAARPLEAADLARGLAEGCSAPTVVDLVAEPAFCRHPLRRLYQLGTALLVPLARPGSVLYLDFAEGRGGAPELALLVQVGRILDARRVQGECGEPPRSIGGLVGRCAAMERVVERIRRLDGHVRNVHVLGETGTGKERVARAVHDLSPRAKGPFITLNAASLGRELCESELFGHVKGAFTGAAADRMGAVEAAHGGTLFLDEVTEMDFTVQSKLLRYLQEGEYRRVGETRVRKADVLIVTASNLDLDAAVAAGQMRKDVRYRLGHHLILLPALRERGDDVLVLARHFLRVEAEKRGRKAPALDPGAARLLERYRWPGNVRELQSVVEQAYLEARHGVVRPEHLPESLREAPAAVETLREAEAAAGALCIRRALEASGGNRTRAAQALGISRQALLGRLERIPPGFELSR